jgi:hypothetical protein
MINAKNEFLEHIKEDTNNSTIKCAQITLRVKSVKVIVNLCVGYTAEDYLIFLESINKNYDNWYSSHSMSGLIWYTNQATWSSHSCYDGCGWWDFYETPEISPELINKNLP